MSCTITPLTHQLLDDTLRLRDAVFSGLSKAEHETLEASIHGREDVRSKLGVADLDYWVAVGENESVHGLIGLYTQTDDRDAAVWLGWFCVDASARGTGIGAALLEFAILEAKYKAFQELKLYTTTAEEYAAARRLYKKQGFADITPRNSVKTRYYSLKL